MRRLKLTPFCRDPSAVGADRRVRDRRAGESTRDEAGPVETLVEIPRRAAMVEKAGIAMASSVLVLVLVVGRLPRAIFVRSFSFNVSLARES